MKNDAVLRVRVPKGMLAKWEEAAKVLGIVFPDYVRLKMNAGEPASSENTKFIRGKEDIEKLAKKADKAKKVKTGGFTGETKFVFGTQMFEKDDGTGKKIWTPKGPKGA